MARHKHHRNSSGITVDELKLRLRHDIHLVRCIRQAVARQGHPPRLELVTQLGEIIDYGPL